MKKGKDAGLQIIIVFAVSFAIYLNALPNGFVYDDNAQVSGNPWIRDIRNIPEIFSQSVWGFRPGGTSNYYRPMMHVFYMVTNHIFGLKPWGFHLVNVLFHAANSLLVFFIMAKLTGEQNRMPASPLIFPPFIAAILFATHPIHTEAVTWVAGLPDLAYSFFFLLSFYFYIRTEELRAGYYILSLISFFLATISKEPALTLPFFLIAYDYVSGNTRKKIPNHLLKYIPYAVICGVYLLLRMHALNGLISNATYENSAPSHNIIDVFPLFTEYLKDLLFPVNLRFWHSFHPIGSIFTTEGVISLAITCSYAGLCAVAWKKNRAIFLSLLLIVLPLLPVFYIQGIAAKPYAERYLYLSSGGFVMLLAMLIGQLPQNMPKRSFIIVIVTLLLAGLYSIQTIRRNPVWKNDLTLFMDTVKKSPDGALPRRILANTLLDMGRIDEAVEQYRIALRLDDNSATGHANLGLALMKKGLIAEAVKEYQRAVAIEPRNIHVHVELGRAYAKSGLTDEAIAQYRAGLSFDPGSVEAGTALGIALAEKGLDKDAIACFEKVLAVDPEYVDAHYSLGSLFANSGQLDEALEHFRAAVRLRPDDAFYRNILGITYGQKGFFHKAIEQFDAAVRLAPSESAYRENLERAKKLKGSDTGKNK